MEDIEYLEEYENIVKPTIDSDLLTSGRKAMTTLNEDDDSSSIDQDMFESLFNDHSDESSFQEREVTKTKRRNDRDSLDSFDMLMKDFGEQLSDNESQKKKTVSVTGNKAKQKASPKDSVAASKFALSPTSNKKNESTPFGKAKSIATVRPTIQNQQRNSQQSTLKRTLITNKYDPKRVSSTQSIISKAHTPSTKLVTTKTNIMSANSKLSDQSPTIVRPEKPQSKDPAEDPLSIESLDPYESDSDSFTLSDVTDDDSLGTLSDWDNEMKDEFEILNDTNSRKNLSKKLSPSTSDELKVDKSKTSSVPVSNKPSIKTNTGAVKSKLSYDPVSKRGSHGRLKRFSDDLLNLAKTANRSDKEQLKRKVPVPDSKLPSKGHKLEVSHIKSVDSSNKISQERNKDIEKILTSDKESTKNSNIPTSKMKESVLETAGTEPNQVSKDKEKHHKGEMDISSCDLIDTQVAEKSKTLTEDSCSKTQKEITKGKDDSELSVKIMYMTIGKSVNSPTKNTSDRGDTEISSPSVSNVISNNDSKNNKIIIEERKVKDVQPAHMEAKTERITKKPRTKEDLGNSEDSINMKPKESNSSGTPESNKKLSNVIMEKAIPKVLISASTCLAKSNQKNMANVKEEMQKKMDEIQISDKTAKKTINFVNVAAEKQKITSNMLSVSHKRKLIDSVAQLIPKKIKTAIGTSNKDVESMQVQENVTENNSETKSDSLEKLSAKQKNESVQRRSPHLTIEDNIEMTDNLPNSNKSPEKEITENVNSTKSIAKENKTEVDIKIKKNQESSAQTKSDDSKIIINSMQTILAPEKKTNKIMDRTMDVNKDLTTANSDSTVPKVISDTVVQNVAVNLASSETNKSLKATKSDGKAEQPKNAKPSRSRTQTPTVTSSINRSALFKRYKLKDLRVRLDRRVVNMYFKNVDKKKQCNLYDSKVDSSITKTRKKVAFIQNDKKTSIGKTLGGVPEALMKLPNTQSENPLSVQQLIGKSVGKPITVSSYSRRLSAGVTDPTVQQSAQNLMGFDTKTKGATPRTKTARGKNALTAKVSALQSTVDFSKGKELKGQDNLPGIMKMPLNTQSMSNSTTSSPNAPLPVLDSNGIRLYSFLYPAEKNKAHESVLLDHCCPNLDGPMPAIDPTRIHKQTQRPCQELPAYIVMTTKVITRAELETNSSSIPASIREKVEKIKANATTASTGVPVASAENATNSKDPSTATVPQNSTDPIKSNEVLLSQNSKQSSVSDRTKPKSDFKETQLRSALRKYDATLKKYCPSFMDVTFPERQEIIEKIIASAKFTPSDIDIAVRLLDEYGKQTITIRPITTTATASKSTTDKSVPKFTTNTTNAVEQITESKNKKNKRPNVKKQVPIFDADKNIIGYQLQKLPTLKVSANPNTSYTAPVTRNLKESLDKKNKNSPFVVKLPIQQPPRIFYTKVTTTQIPITQSATPSPRIEKISQLGKETITRPINPVSKQTRDITNTRRHSSVSGSTRTSNELDASKVVTSKQTVVQVVESPLKRSNRKTGRSTKLIVITNANNNSDVGECILPDDNTTNIKTEKEDDFIG